MPELGCCTIPYYRHHCCGSGLWWYPGIRKQGSPRSCFWLPVLFVVSASSGSTTKV